MKQIDVAIAVIVRGAHALICQRKQADTFGGFWEFPGGKRESGETLEQCLLRELREELDIDVVVLRPLTTIEHNYPHVALRLCPFLCSTPDREPRPIECQRFAWVTADALSRYQFPPANESLLNEVAQILVAHTRHAEATGGAD
jgi:mutator protein MutT